MATYRTVYLSYWTDSKVEDDFTPEDKYFYLYILTNPHTNLCGCYEISMSSMTKETGYNEGSIKRLLDRMENVHQVLQYDKETKEVFIPKWGKYNWANSPKTIQGAVNVASHIKSERLRKAFNDTLSIGYGYPMDTSVTDIDINNTSNKSNTNKKNKEDDHVLEERFNIFWEAYPRKVKKKDARKSWDKIKPSDELLNTMLKSVEEWKKTEQWQDDRFIPHPSVWLNGERWNDEVPLDPLEKLRRQIEEMEKRQ